MTKPKGAPSRHTAAVDVATFAKAVQMSTSAVRLMIDRGDLHAVRLGRAVRIPVTEFARLGLGTPAFLMEEAA